MAVAAGTPGSAAAAGGAGGTGEDDATEGVAFGCGVLATDATGLDIGVSAEGVPAVSAEGVPAVIAEGVPAGIADDVPAGMSAGLLADGGINAGK